MWRCVVGGLLCAGCASSLAEIKPEERAQLETKTIPLAFEQVMAAVVSVLEDNGFMVASVDRPSGLVATDYRYTVSNSPQAIAHVTRSKVRVTVTKLDDRSSQVHVQQTTEVSSAHDRFLPADRLIDAQEYREFCRRFFEAIQTARPSQAPSHGSALPVH